MSGAVVAVEVEFDVEFFFEEVRTAFGIAEVFGDVAAGVDFKSDGATLEGSAHALDALAMRVIETFGNADERGEAAGDALVVIVEGGIGGVMAVGRGLAIVVAHDGSDQTAITTFEARDVSIKREVFAVLVMTAMTDAVTYIVEKGAGFELYAGLRGKMVNGLELIEEHRG